MTAAAGLLILALLGQQAPRTYYWRDAAGQTHVTNTPPPPNAEILEPPQPMAVEPAQAARPEPVRQSASRGGHRPVVLNPAQQQAWAALDRHLAKARSAGDLRTVAAVTDSLVHDCLWGNGLWAMPAIPLLSVVLLALMGWWLAIGLHMASRIPLISAFMVLGLAFGHLLLNVFLYHPQAVRLRQNLELLEQYNGSGRPVRPELHLRLQQRYAALERAAEPVHLPWQFPGEVKALEALMQQVMVEP